MLTSLLLGYLAVSTLTFLFIYSAYVVAARADEAQEETLPSILRLPRPVKHTQTPAEIFALSTQ